MRISDWSSDVCSSDLQLIGLKDVGADLVAPADLRLGLIFARSGFLPAAQFRFVEARLQHVHRGGAVLVLRPVILRRDDDARRNVGDADGGVRCVDVLAASSEEHTSELQSLIRSSYAVFCL